MINNTSQVNPGNGVNFSKIRKASQGTKISKFQTPASGIGNRKNTYITQDDWWNTHNQENIAQWAKIAAEHPEMTLDELNNFIAQNHNLYLSTGYNGDKAIKGNEVNQYQLDYHNKYGFGNTDAFWSGWGNAYSGTSLNTGDLRPGEGQTFTGDDYFGEQTNRRLANYFNDSELEAANNAVKSRGWRWELSDYNDQDNRSGINGRKFYKLVQDEQPPRTSPGGGDIPKDIPGDYTPDDYYNFQFKPEPFLTPNPFIAGLGLAANRHQFMNEMNKKVPLLEAPYLQGKVTNNYAARQMRNQQMADIRSQAQKQLSSDMIQNQMYLQAVEQGFQPLENQNVADQTNEFNQTSQNLQNIENQNKLTASQVANQNRSNLIADWNNKLNAKSKYQWTRNNIKSDFINKTWTDYQQWAAGEKNERDSALSAYNDYLANLDMQKAMKNYWDLAADPTKSRSFAAIYQKAHNDFDSNLSNGQWHADNKELSELFENKDGLDQNELNKAFMDYLRTSNSDYATTFDRGFGSELNTLKNQTIINKQRIKNQLAQTYPSFRNTYIGGWGPWDRRHLGRIYRTIYEKNGGILKMKYGSRFVNYLEHNRKAIKDQKQTTMEVSKQMERELKTQLESLDRETLILLRSIFK